MKSIDEKGFLSKEIQNWIDKHRNEHKEWFSLIENINILAQKLMLSLEPLTDDGQKVIVTILFARILSHFQGVVLLAERGMVPESRSLLRGMLDATFAEVALSKHKNLVQVFVDDDLWQRIKCMNSFMALPKTIKKHHRIGNTKLKNQVNEIQKEIDEKNIKPLTTEFLAQKAEMLPYYNTLFVMLCSSTHSRARDLEQYLVDKESSEIESLRWGPDAANIEDILQPACDLLFIAARGISNLFNGSELDDEFQEQSDIYQELIGRKPA